MADKPATTPPNNPQGASSPPSPSSGAHTPKPAHAPVAAKSQPGQAPSLPPGNGAGQIARRAESPAPNGKPRKDNLTPGSPEALEADRKKARDQKAAQRARIKATQPVAPLPSRPVTPLAAQTQHQIPAQETNGMAPMPLEDVQVVPWTAQDCSPALQDTLEILEEADKIAIEGKLKKANLSPENAREIMEDVPWPERSKQSISRRGGSALARVLNWMGVDSKYSDAVNVIPAFAYLLYDRTKLHKRLDELVAAANQPATKPTEKKT